MTESTSASKSRGCSRTGLEAERSFARSRLEELASRMALEGMPRPALDGKILRPLTAYVTVPRDRRDELDERFWWGALAVEMVHEASLLHDDILDEAAERRGKPTLAASAGVGPALVLGDHLLTSAYRVAARTESMEFLNIFIRSVERTVAGEIAQEKNQGRILSQEEYRSAISGKSGELFRSAFALGPSLLDFGSPEGAGALGARLGCIYQMVDDFLDYCTSADRGKSPLQDYRQRKWTWPLGLLDARGFEADAEEIIRALFSSRPGQPMSPMEDGLTRMEGEVQALLGDLAAEGMEAAHLDELLGCWLQSMRLSAENEVSRVTGSMSKEGADSAKTPVSESRRGELASAAAFLDTDSRRLAYFGKHASSFRFASRLFPSDALKQVAGVYAFCRFTDDLVDEAVEQDPAFLGSLLDEWLALSREAYAGCKTGVRLLDEVVGEMAQSQVPFHYLEDLIQGVRMDLEPREYRTLEDLRVYSYRVASVVGGWLTELFGVRDPWALERAFALGHAMQLTNILRDVGEDLRKGRVYLPTETMASRGVDRGLLEAMANQGGLVLPGYQSLLEDLMAEAEKDYLLAFEAIPSLPPFFQGPVAVAARVYQGIHREIRRGGFDNLNKRARTSLPRKGWLGALGLLNLVRERRRGRVRADCHGEPHATLPSSSREQEVVA